MPPRWGSHCCGASALFASYTDAAGYVRSEIGGTETERLVVLIGTGAGVMRSPPRRVLEPADGADATIFAKRKPVRRPARYAQEITSSDLDRNHSLLDVQEENAAASKDETHFVFRVGVLLVEFRQHSFQIRGGGSYVDDIGRHISASNLHFLDFLGVGAEHILRGRIWSYAIEAPSFVFNAKACEVATNCRFIFNN